MLSTDHEIRFVYALYFLFALILRAYHLPVLDAIFIIWVAWEDIFAIMNNISFTTFIIANIIGLFTFFFLYHFITPWIYLVLTVYVVYGLYLNYLGLRNIS